MHDQTRKLIATGYTMSQRDFLPGEEFVFGRYLTHQARIEDIEEETGLGFGALTALDPMKIIDEAPALPLQGFDDIRFD